MGDVVQLDDVRPKGARTGGDTDVLAILAHDMRTSLSVLRGFALTLDRHREQLGAGQVTSALGAMRQHADALARLTDEMIDVARASAKALPLTLSTVDVRALATDAVERARGTHSACRFELAFRGPHPVVVADRRRVAQILSILLESAARVAPPGSAVGTTVIRVRSGVVVRIRDRGPRLPAGAGASIFCGAPHPPGVRGPSAGLHLCRLLVEAHGGRIWALSSGKTGATFGFLLPDE